MSLLVDHDYAIHALRIAYLRRIDDHAGPRVLSLPHVTHSPGLATSPRHNGDRGLPGALAPIQQDTVSKEDASSDIYHTHVSIAGLDSARYQPELLTLHSPKIASALPLRKAGNDGGSDLREFSGMDASSSRNGDTPSRPQQGSRLNYTTTLIGPGRSGALGMRVSGRRATSGDLPKRRRGSPKDVSFVDEESEEDSDDMQSQQKYSETTARQLSNPSDVVTAHTFGKGQRSSSFQLPLRDVNAEALAASRNRSSSQPQKVPTASTSLVPKEEAGKMGSLLHEDTAMSQSASHDTPTSTPRATPPPRPPRRMQAAEPGSPESQRSHSREQEPLASAATGASRSSPVARIAALTARKRSASEGMAEKGAVANRGERSDTMDLGNDPDNMEMLGEPDEAVIGPGMRRDPSSSTLFSLASPPTAFRSRGLSDRWHQQDGLHSPLSSSKTSQSSMQQRADSAEKLAAGAQHALGLSPRSRHEGVRRVSEAYDRSQATEGDDFSQSSSSRFGGSLDVGSSSRIYSLPDASLEHTDSFQGKSQSDVASTASIDSAIRFNESRSTPASRAAEVAAECDIRPSSPSQRSVRIDEARRPDPRRAPNNMQSATSRPETRSASSQHRIDQSKRDYFASTKTDSQTVARRFAQVPKRSGLSALLSKHGDSPMNPFASAYTNIEGGSVANAAKTSVKIYFPFATSDGKGASAKMKPGQMYMTLSVRKDATMEELIGYSLYRYVEMEWRPPLEEGLPRNASEEQLAQRLSTVGWTLRIVEDGEVDDDYPAIDQSLTVGKFGADELAVCEASAAQVRQHLTAARHLPRQTSHTAKQAGVESSASKKDPRSTASATAGFVATNAPGNAYTMAPGGPSARLAATAGNMTAGSLINFEGTPIFASSLTSQGGLRASSNSIFLRILITPNNVVKYKTTLQVPSDTYLADVLETICRKRQLANVDEWALVVAEKNVIVPLDRTVESLQGSHDLALVRRQDLGKEAAAKALTSQSTNPNASIFKRLSEPAPLARFNTAAKELGSTYKSYTVTRKQTSFLGKHERVFTIDGDWIHIIPTDTKAFQTQSGTSSFPITAILSCSSSRLPSSFKLIVARENDQKRYEFEAESAKVAAEIIEEINILIRRFS